MPQNNVSLIFPQPWNKSIIQFWTAQSSWNGYKSTSRELEILGRFSAIFYKGDNFGNFLFAFLQTDPF